MTLKDMDKSIKLPLIILLWILVAVFGALAILVVWGMILGFLEGVP